MACFRALLGNWFKAVLFQRMLFICRALFHCNVFGGHCKTFYGFTCLIFPDKIY